MLWDRTTPNPSGGAEDLSASSGPTWQRRPPPPRKKARRVGRALDRFSLRVVGGRAAPHRGSTPKPRTCPVKHRNPAVYVTRRNGVPTVVEIKAIGDVAARPLKQMTI
jgi:hypothetical protein